MKDFCNQEFKINDKVIIIQPHYRNFVEGKIIKITKKMVVVEYHYQGRNHQVKQFFHQIIKKPYREYYLNEELK